MPVYYTICPAPVPVVKGTVFNEILTLMRRFCTNKVEILTETANGEAETRGREGEVGGGGGAFCFAGFT